MFMVDWCGGWWASFGRSCFGACLCVGCSNLRHVGVVVWLWSGVSVEDYGSSWWTRHDRVIDGFGFMLRVLWWLVDSVLCGFWCDGILFGVLSSNVYLKFQCCFGSCVCVEGFAHARGWWAVSTVMVMVAKCW